MSTPLEAPQRPGRDALPFVVLGAAATIAGGLVSAVAIQVPTSDKSWVSAYLVLVVGVATVIFGWGQAMFASPSPSGRLVGLEIITWAAGNALIIVGTLADSPIPVYAGSAMLITVLMLLAHSVGRRPPDLGSPRAVAYTLFWIVFVIVLASIPVGVVLAASG